MLRQGVLKVANSGNPAEVLRNAITEHDEFKFDMSDIVRFRKEMKILITNLGKVQNEQTEADELPGSSKKSEEEEEGVHPLLLSTNSILQEPQVCPMSMDGEDGVEFDVDCDVNHYHDHAEDAAERSNPRPPADSDALIEIDVYDEWFQELTGVLQPDDDWVTVEYEMTSLNKSPRLHYVPKGLNDSEKEVWIFPGRKQPSQGGVLSHDFIDDEFDLKTFAVNSFNWIGDEEYLCEKAQRDGGKRHQHDQGLPPDAAPKRRKKVVPVLAPERKRDHAIFGVDHQCNFQTQVTAIEKFFRGTKTILYICGSPGVGKTTAIHWCCDQAEKAVRAGQFEGVVNILIGRVTVVVSINAIDFLNEIAGVLEMTMTLKTYKKSLQKLTRKNDLVILVIDEGDKLTSAKDGSKMYRLWLGLCALATNSAGKFRVVGISNAVDNAVAKKVTKNFDKNVMVSCDLWHRNDQSS